MLRLRITRAWYEQMQALRSVLFSVAASITVLSSAVASAQTSSESAFFEFFRMHCLLNVPRIDKVQAAALVFGWTSLKGDTATLLAPTDSRASFESWVTENDGQKLIVGISEGKLNGRKMVTCSISGRNLNQDALAKIIELDAGRTLDVNEVEHLQRYRGWLSSKDARPIRILLTTSSDNAISSATLAVMADPDA